MTRRPSLLVQPAPYHIEGHAEVHGMDEWLSNLDTILIAIRQRRMTPDQLDRYTRLIHAAEADSVMRAAA